MRTIIPRSLHETMDERYIYEAMQEGGYILNLPKYKDGTFCLSEKCIQEAEQTPLCLQYDIIWTIMADAHDKWRKQPKMLEMMLSEDCRNCLNVFLRLELSGPDVFIIWANKFLNRFNLAGFDPKQTLGEDGYEDQKSWMRDINFMLPEMLHEIFLINRRRFVEDSNETGMAPMVDKRDLYEYLTNTFHDVLGVCSWQIKNHEMAIIRDRICRALYQDGGTRTKLYPESDIGLDFRLTRQTILANGGTSPVDW